MTLAYIIKLQDLIIPNPLTRKYNSQPISFYIGLNLLGIHVFFDHELFDVKVDLKSEYQ